MNFKNENLKENGKNFKKKMQQFLNKNISTKDNMKKYDPIIINNNNLNKFINSTKTPNNKHTSYINNNFNIINTPNVNNKIELKLYPETEIKKISFNPNIFPKKIFKNENNNNILTKNICDKDFEINKSNYINISLNTVKKYTIYTKENKEKSTNIDNSMNNFNNHKYLYVNNSKEKDKNKKYIIEKNIKTNDNIDEYNNKNQNDINKSINDNNIGNPLYVNNLNERIEKMRETLQNLNVIDILSEEAGLQSSKIEEFNDNEFYDKAKKINKEFYDNVDIKLDEIDNILNIFENP